uniref:Collagen triple helix repeat protein n=1 Tax=Haemonchus placei TaxID=6290 RepID=A0A0N4W3U0_HAEPC
LPFMWYRISAIRSLLLNELSAFAELEQRVWIELRTEAKSSRVSRQVYDYCECEYHNDCPRGAPGRRGIPGEDGIHGKNGAPGLPGAPGILPATLYQHIDGCMVCPFGSKGKQGAPGPPGPQGMAGSAGRNGHNGIPGAKGSPGEDGPPGTSGGPGSDGRWSLYFLLRMLTVVHMNG